MPSIITRGGMSAQAFGWGAASIVPLGGPFFFGSWGDTPSSGANTALINGVGIDSSSNMYIGGDDVNASYSPAQNLELIKISSSGYVGLQRRYGVPTYGTGAAGANPLYTDSSGNSYICGSYYRSASSRTVISVLKINSSGVVQWQTYVNYSSPSAPDPKCISVDSSGNVFVGGRIPPDAFGGVGIGFIFKINSTGSFQWMRTVGTRSVGNGDSVTAITNDPSGDLYVGMSSSNTVINAYGMYVIKYNTSGTLQWQRLFYDGSANSYVIAGSMTASSSYLYIGVRAQQVGGGSYQSAVVKYDLSGSLQWQKTLYQSAGSPNLQGISIDASENVYISGSCAGANTQGFLAKYNSAGALQWQRYIRFDSVSGNLANNVASSVYGEISFAGTAYLDGTSTAYSFFGRVPRDGSKTGTYSLPYGSSGLTNSVIYDAYNATAATGAYSDSSTTVSDASISPSSGSSALSTTTTSQSSGQVTL